MMNFDHVKTIIAIILGLSITHLLKGIIKFIQHPKSIRPYWVHILWCTYILLLIIHFWWWESYLKIIKHWNFGEYLFVFIYICGYYFLCSLLLPEQLDDYKDYESYYYYRKKWFFGTLGLLFLLDFVDTFIKGWIYYSEHYTIAYPIRNIVHIILCLIAMSTSSRKYHSLIVILFILYEFFYIYRFFVMA